MPRIRQYSAKYALEDFSNNIRKAGNDMGLNNAKQISERVGIPYQTLVLRLKNPGTLKMEEVLQIIDGLSMSADAFAPLFRKGKAK